MGVGAGIFAVVTSLSAASAQQRSGRQAQSAAEENAKAIESETRVNIRQTRRSQAQTMGMAKANIAASGVRFDASKIGAVEFAEAGEATPSQATTTPTGEVGTESVQAAEADYRAATFEGEVEQVGGETEGGSIFTYLREMKRTFAEDIAWQTKEGAARARVTRMGGQVARSQAQAGALGSVSSAAGSFASTGRSAGWWK